MIKGVGSVGSGDSEEDTQGKNRGANPQEKAARLSPDPLGGSGAAAKGGDL